MQHAQHAQQHQHEQQSQHAEVKQHAHTGTPTCLHQFLNRQAFCRCAAMYDAISVAIDVSPHVPQASKDNAFCCWLEACLPKWQVRIFIG